MNEKPIPEFMKEYMERIGHECYMEYQSLSKEYHDKKREFFEEKMPRWVPAYGRQGQRVDVEAEMRRIDIEYKEKALETGCRYGYEIPEPEHYDNPYPDQIDKDDFGMLPEDKQAMQAHQAFEEKFPEKAEERELNRETIDYFFGENPYTPQPVRAAPETPLPEISKAQEKEDISREELVSRFSLSRNDMIQPEDPGLSRDDIDRTPDRDDMEIEMER